MLKDRLKQKAKKKAKQKVRSEAKKQVRQAARKEGGPKVLKAAAVGGAGYYAGKKISESGQEIQTDTYAAPPAPEAGAVEASDSDMVTQLQQLAQLHDSGVLTDDEFATAKQKLLAGG